MPHLDITLDFETLSLLPTAAPVKLAAVAWSRNEPLDLAKLASESFSVSFDVRDAIAEGLSIDQSTLTWWSTQDPSVKRSVLKSGTLLDIADAMSTFLGWIDGAKTRYNAETVTIWAQGSDFDISILRNLMHIAHLDEDFKKLVPYLCLRDARTLVLELGKTLVNFKLSDAPIPGKSIYSAIDSASSFEQEMKHLKAHDPYKDCIRTTVSVYTVLHSLDGKDTYIS